jgi:multiple sugar transport system substrate-binding protein
VGNRAAAAARGGDALPGASLAGGSSLVVFRGTRSPEATWLWLEYLSQPEQQARFLELSGNLPARRSVWEAGGLAEDPRTAAFLAQLEHAVPTPKVPEWERIATRIAQAGEQVARGARSLDGRSPPSTPTSTGCSRSGAGCSTARRKRPPLARRAVG